MTILSNISDLSDAAIARLYHLGYIDNGIELQEVLDIRSLPELQDAIAHFQQANNIVETGTVDSETLTALTIARCMTPDRAGSVCAWPANMPKTPEGNLLIKTTHRIENLNPLAAELERKAWLQALANWSQVCGIELVLHTSFADSNIHAEVSVLDAGTLAYSYLPCNAKPTTKLEQRYNRAVNWNYNLLVQVITHEIGHAIGLDHGPRGALMQPTANGDILTPQAWDITEVVKRYGPRKGSVPKPNPTPTPEGGKVVGKLVLDQTLNKGEYAITLRDGKLEIDYAQ
jgi:hypothetical protein